MALPGPLHTMDPNSASHHAKTKSGPSIHQHLRDSPPEHQSRAIPSALIDFIVQDLPIQEPPRKRQRLASEKELDFITVKESTWDIKVAGSKLSKYQLPLCKDNVTARVSHGPVRSVCILDSDKKAVFEVSLPEDKEAMDDIHLALAAESNSWAKGEGKIWTEFGVALLRQDGYDVIRLKFTLKWNVTTSPYRISQVSKKMPILPTILNTYFPNPNVTVADTWSPQDFYQNVHSPEKDDEVAVSIKTFELEPTLFPFQKRAVQWMLRREGVEWSDDLVRSVDPSDKYEPIASFIKTIDARGRSCYVSHLFGLVTLDVTPFTGAEKLLKGGILAEEMGLGKTIETISLMSLHKRPLTTPVESELLEDLIPTPATLIVTPPSILQQWISEINKHAPGMTVTHYEGIKNRRKMDMGNLLEELATSDVVLTTYSVLAAEINFTSLNPEKSLRKTSKYPRPKSPLMQLSWWRVVMDEAQMIESGVSKAAVVAEMIPRVNAWCVTGTPVRKDVDDLRGLLVFLRFEPFASTKHVWSSLITTNKHEFRQLFGRLALRHTKQSVRDELKLPAQRRYVITMPFTPIEEQHYSEIFSEMCAECGVDAEGAPLFNEWDPERYSETMRRWLVRLRQTALHPEVGGKNRRALGNKDGPLRTVDQVLDVMMEQTDVAIRADQRALFLSKLKRGQLDENSPRVRNALAIWEEVVKEASAAVDECREQLREEASKASAEPNLSPTDNHNLSSYDSDSSNSASKEDDPSSRLSAFRMRLRSALEIEHLAIFFRTNAYFQIKSNEDMTQPDSPEFLALDKSETEGYEIAQKLRREILQEILRKSDRLMRGIAKKAATQSFAQIPEFPSELPKSGLESRRIMEQLDTLAQALDAQADTLDEWREQTVQFLLRPLVDEDEGLEITGDEYEDSTKTQDEIMVYVLALRAAIADRHDALTGQENHLNAVEIRTALHWAKEGEGAFPEKTIELLEVRSQIKPTKEMGSMRGIISELRSLATTLRPDAEAGNVRSANELAIVEKQLRTAQKQLTEQTKTTKDLEKEIELFTSVTNTRIEYYRQLQQISDMVAPYEGVISDAVRDRMLEDEARLLRKIATAKSKRRYLDHLKAEAANPKEQRMCIICQETFEVGALTICGHQFCKECIRIWWQHHHSCPICKRRLTPADLHPITYKPQELSIETEDAQSPSQDRSSPSAKSRKTAIYSEISKTKLSEIKNIELDGPSFTTKVDTLARHLIWLRETDPGSKSIIYSQFKEFLSVLAGAFEKYRIGYTSIDKPKGIEKFKKEPGIECFLLHSRAHSSGLNLVNASHVFLCEPLLHTALELQAIARVDRIGQQQETNVWLYLVDGTVEESVHQLSVKRRMEHIGQTVSGKKQKNGKGKAKEMTPEEILDTNLEEANSMELQQASLTRLLAKGEVGGEMVDKEDLWECLFGTAGRKEPTVITDRTRAINDHRLRFDREVQRHLGAGAAEQRRVEIMED